MYQEQYITSIYYIGLTALLITIILHICPIISNPLNALVAILNKHWDNFQVVTYAEAPLSQVSLRRLETVSQKILVLDMDETLITSIFGRCYDGHDIQLPDVPYDYTFTLPEMPCVFYVYKRPHVDFFLEKVSQWYSVYIYTAAHERYASVVLDMLEDGRALFGNRLYRQHCINLNGVHGKFVGLVTDELANVLLVDNSDVSCSLNCENSIRIKSFRIDQRDTALLNLLPFLDALRFTKDVRSILRRSTRYEGVCNAFLQR